MFIRRAEKKDIEKIKDLLKQVNNVHNAGRPDLFKKDCLKYNDSELDELIADNGRPVFVADENGAVLGYAFCVLTEHKNDNNLADMKTLYIDDLCVDENIRGKHIGKTIYEYVKNYAGEEGCYNITLNVWECNKNAKAFYEKCGLKPQKTTLEDILR